MIQKESFSLRRGRGRERGQKIMAEAPVRFILNGELAAHRKLVLEYGVPPVSFPPGTTLSRASELPARVYYLLEGMTKAYTSNASGFVRLLGYHRADTICVLDGLRGEDPCVVTIETITPVRAIPLTSEDLCRLGDLSPAFAMDLAFFVGDTLRLMCFDAENQSIGDVTTRLGNFFRLYMSSADYRKDGYIPMSQENLASAVNASRIQVARICSRLQKEGIIRTRRGKVFILNEKVLDDLPSCP